MSEPVPPTFETALTELEAVIRDLEDGSLTLDNSLARYEQGVALLRSCYERLQAAEQKIQLLAGIDEEGRPIFQPFAHETSHTKPASKPGTRRGKDPG